MCLCHQGYGLQHVKAADGTTCQMHLGAALPGGLLHLLVKREVSEGTDGQDDQIHAPAQNRQRHGTHCLNRGGLHDVFGLQCQQRIHGIADGAAGFGGSCFSGGTGAAGHTHQLVLRQQAVLPCVGHNIAQKAAAHDAQFRFHSLISPFPAQSAVHSLPV